MGKRVRRPLSLAASGEPPRSGSLRGVPRAAVATLYNTHVESSILESWWPTDNAERMFEESVPQKMLASLEERSTALNIAQYREG